MITDLNAQIANADSSSTIGHLLHLATEVERLSAGVAEYDSSELISSTAEVGSIRYVDDGTLRVYDSDNWRNILNYHPSQAPTPPSFTFQGSSFGYTMGGIGSPNKLNTIEKYSFTSDANGTDVGDLLAGRRYGSGNNSSTNGYHSAHSDNNNVIEKFPFSSDGNSTDAADLTQARGRGTAASADNGYQNGGFNGGPAYYTMIDKFPFAADNNATNVGDIAEAHVSGTGHTSPTHGYANSGSSGTNVNSYTIEKFLFSNEGSVTDVADLSKYLYGASEGSSTNHGYASGGANGSIPPPGVTYINEIVKFSFTSDGADTDVGDLTAVKFNRGGSSSTTHGYNAGGFPPNLDVIDKFAFAADGNATDVGDLTEVKRHAAGTQV